MYVGLTLFSTQCSERAWVRPDGQGVSKRWVPDRSRQKRPWRYISLFAPCSQPQSPNTPPSSSTTATTARMDGHLHAGNESPPTRTTILGSFLRGRPRNSSQSHIQVNTDIRDTSPSNTPQPPSPRRRTIVSAAITPNNTNPSQGLGITSMLRRRRSAGNVAGAQLPPAPPAITSSATAAAVLGMGTYNGRPSAAANNINNNINNATGATNPAGTHPTTAVPASSSTGAPAGALMHRIRLVPHLDTRRSLRFDAISRDLREGDPALRIGRFTDRSGLGLAAVNALGSNKLAFRSKVVSRAHAEIWVELGGKFYVKDTKSSSGTFLNHVRLSPANTESRPCQIKDGDILQLGVDYQGGAEDIYKSVKIRIELGREWQASANAFKYVQCPSWLIFCV